MNEVQKKLLQKFFFYERQIDLNWFILRLIWRTELELVGRALRLELFMDFLKFLWLSSRILLLLWIWDASTKEYILF